MLHSPTFNSDKVVTFKYLDPQSYPIRPYDGLSDESSSSSGTPDKNIVSVNFTWNKCELFSF